MMSPASPDPAAPVAADDIWLGAPFLGAASPPLHRRAAALVREATQLIDCPTGTVTRVRRADPIFSRATGRRDMPLRATSLAYSVILSREVEIVCDASRDQRFAGDLHVSLFPKARFMAGFPLLDGDSLKGALTLVDYVPRPHPPRSVVKELERLSRRLAHTIAAAD